MWATCTMVKWVLQLEMSYPTQQLESIQKYKTQI